MEILKQILKEHKETSGQCVNYDKSFVYFSSNVEEGERMRILDCLGVCVSYYPKRHLGLPNMVGRSKKRACQGLKDRLRSRINSWCVRLFSQGGMMYL